MLKTRNQGTPEALACEIIEYDGAGFGTREIRAIRETPLTIFLNGREVVTLLCTARSPRFLTLGFLKSDALIRDKSDITSFEMREGNDRIVAYVEVKGDPWENRTIERSITSGCGKGTNFGRNLATISRRTVDSSLTVTPEQILALSRELHQRSTLYADTGGCHNSSLCTPDEMLLFREDIGRHNAIDTIIGQCFEEGISTHDKLIVSSGRSASEILLKVVRMGIPVLVSSAVATSMAIDLARRTGLTLVGRVRENSFRVYNDPGRIKGL